MSGAGDVQRTSRDRAPKMRAGGPPKPVPGRTPRRRPSRKAVAIAVAIVIGLALILVGSAIVSGPDRFDGIRIYSSLPQREQLQPAPDADPVVAPNKRTKGMENAMRLALDDAGGTVGDREVEYQPLDDSDANGASPAAIVQANARRAAHDTHAAVYIGDFTSGATQESLPILSRARVPQISVSSTRVGLTKRDPLGDVDEPARYYPRQHGRNGYRNFVRLIPTTAVHARALLALMKQQDGCTKVAMINDDSSYGQALANDIRARNRGRVTFAFNQSAGPSASYYRLVELARTRRADCFVYSGIRNANTVEIFKAFADALPTAKLYGSNGLVAASFVDPKEGGLPQRVADRVQVMVPPYRRDAARRFLRDFKAKYGTDADAYAVYAYEAMRLALEAIARSRSGKREDIVRELLQTDNPPDSVLGPYAIKSTGDTNVDGYGVSRIANGKLTPPVPAPRLQRIR